MLMVSTKKSDIFKKNIPRAQTTRLASFGPVIVLAVQLNPLCSCKTLIEPKNRRNHKLVCKKHEKEKKNLPRDQTTPDASFGPVIVLAVQLNPLRSCKTSIEPKNCRNHKLI